MKTFDVKFSVQVLPYTELTPEDALLVDRAKAATATSYAPYSHFRVGAAIALADGHIVCGSNQENVAFSPTSCAERTALNWASAEYPGTVMHTIAIAARRDQDETFLSTPISPCGVCRQALLEVEKRQSAPLRIILYGTEQVYIVASISDLLPLQFDSF